MKQWKFMLQRNLGVKRQWGDSVQWGFVYEATEKYALRMRMVEKMRLICLVFE